MDELTINLLHRMLELLFDRVNWTRLMQILKGNGTDWWKRKLIN